MNKTLYLECASGISGDMTVAALLDLGADEEKLRKALKSLNVDGYYIEIKRVNKQGIDVMDFDVIIKEENSHNHSHNEQHNHVHRNLNDINHIIEQMDASEKVKVMSKKMFQIIAESEAKAHGLPIEKVHFHEVGAIDSIVDIISVAVCMEDLKIERVIVPKVCEGTGFVKCQHGTLSVPVPAVINIASEYKLNLEITDIKGEMITPTGAAIVAAYSTSKSLPKGFVIEKVGIGAGKREYEKLNVLRAMIISDEIDCDNKENENIWVLESNIDDATGENLGYTMELLFKVGANDVYFSPIYMKKCRPAYKLSIICTENNIEKMEEIIFKNTTTIGIRKYPVIRSVLNRKMEVLRTGYGEIDVKKCSNGKDTFYYPEYDSLLKICNEKNVSFKEAYYEFIHNVIKNKYL